MSQTFFVFVARSYSRNHKKFFTSFCIFSPFLHNSMAAPNDAVYDISYQYDFRAISMLLLLKCLVIVIKGKCCSRHDEKLIVIRGKHCSHHDNRGIIIIVNGLNQGSPLGLKNLWCDYHRTNILFDAQFQ